MEGKNVNIFKENNRSTIKHGPKRIKLKAKKILRLGKMKKYRFFDGLSVLASWAIQQPRMSQTHFVHIVILSLPQKLV